MSEPSYKGSGPTGTPSRDLAETIWKMATTAAREQYEARVAELEDSVTAIREHLAVRVEGSHSEKA